MIKDKFGKFVVQIANNEQVKTEFYQNYVLRPAKRFFSMGMISGDKNTKNNEPIKETKDAK